MYLRTNLYTDSILKKLYGQGKLKRLGSQSTFHVEDEEEQE